MSEKIIRVIFSSDAFNTILTETFHKDPSETGGILLGNSENDDWYIINCIEPGPGSVFRSHYFEYDQVFVNYLAKAHARRYHIPLRVLGLWHRHPGRFDQFSSTDDGTNLAFARLSEKGSLSGLVNLDPDFRLTLFHFDERLKYRKVPYIVSDEVIPRKFLRKKYENFHFVATPLKNEPDREENFSLSDQVLDIIIHENEILAGQEFYECTFECLSATRVSYTCLLNRTVTWKNLPDKIFWQLVQDGNSFCMQINRDQKIPYKPGCFLDFLNKTIGTDPAGPKNLNHEAK